MPDELRCACCGECADKRCAECRLVAYCSKECQKRDWKNHRKSECVKSEKIEEVVDTADMEIRVGVGESPVHGRGVFATADILSGERVCFFDGEDRSLRFKVTMVRQPPSKKGSDEDTLSIKNAAAVFEHTIRGLRDLDMFAKHSGKADVVRIGKREPDSDFGVGQFINDGAMPALREPALDFSAGYDCLKEYLAASQRKANVTLSAGGGYWFEATRRIRRGEELFTHYGFEFWLQKFLHEASEPVRRFYYYSLMDQRTKPFNLTLLYQYDGSTCREFLKTVLGDGELADETEDPKWELLKLSERINLQ